MSDEQQRRVELSRTILRALADTWESMDQKQGYDAAVHDRIIRGGCTAFLEGGFCRVYDSISLAIALLTVAREGMIQNGGELPENPHLKKEELS